MSQDVITLDCGTTTGGKVITGSGNMKVNGKLVALVGDMATCSCGSRSCSGTGPIVATSPRNANIYGQKLARAGDFVDTGCGSCYVKASPYQVSLGTDTSGSVNIGAGINVGQGVNINTVGINMGSGVNIGRGMSMTQTSQPQAGLTTTNAAGISQPILLPPQPGEPLFSLDGKKPEATGVTPENRCEIFWDTSQQKTVSIAVCTLDEAIEYLHLLKVETQRQITMMSGEVQAYLSSVTKDSYNDLSGGKDYAGLGSGMKAAYEAAKDLGAFGATAKAIDINGKAHIVIENYKPRYLDLGITWKEATPQMLKVGYGLNTFKGNAAFFKGNVFVEIVFSGAVNGVDYMMHHEQTLSHVVGRWLGGDVIRGITAAAVAQGLVLLIEGGLLLVGSALPVAAALGIFAVGSFVIGNYISSLDKQYHYTQSMKDEIEKLIHEYTD
ncbi:hypothetical protein VR7878_03312 [Vibrio ruber DSM 16370]|uniref:PAAR motif protein n=1 Tax=Vibrio ruber (strain DSM 16370 / JCM 11486 / BCRC 17186 / CECT 7878 / LMG 23124 / VR1) TaxID=1123498 RepID=A0A1R4LS84_VIBR1|nr:PAAR domain-containing protein [Vibrio ruber]SJN59249.1 hypothetical protein VR7878_03312 [Vibrio ruber DSM 16370]